MTNTPPSPDDDAKGRRDKLFGRLMIIALGLLVLAYLIPTFFGGR